MWKEMGIEERMIGGRRKPMTWFPKVLWLKHVGPNLSKLTMRDGLPSWGKPTTLDYKLKAKFASDYTINLTRFNDFNNLQGPTEASQRGQAQKKKAIRGTVRFAGRRAACSVHSKALFYAYYVILLAVAMFGAVEVGVGCWVSASPSDRRRGIGKVVVWASVVAIVVVAGLGFVCLAPNTFGRRHRRARVLGAAAVLPPETHYNVSNIRNISSPYTIQHGIKAGDLVPLSRFRRRCPRE
uniref:Uncharacterized protein n=1 Tax=Oryza glumipatula TaxID=40148 RepID=A0A0D9ZHS8_9ORYZ